jgi:hypothetical protein
MLKINGVEMFYEIGNLPWFSAFTNILSAINFHDGGRNVFLWIFL